MMFQSSFYGVLFILALSTNAMVSVSDVDKEVTLVRSLSKKWAHASTIVSRDGKQKVLVAKTTPLETTMGQVWSERYKTYRKVRNRWKKKKTVYKIDFDGPSEIVLARATNYGTMNLYHNESRKNCKERMQWLLVKLYKRSGNLSLKYRRCQRICTATANVCRKNKTCVNGKCVRRKPTPRPTAAPSMSPTPDPTASPIESLGDYSSESYYSSE